jgi:hypothetical protein
MTREEECKEEDDGGRGIPQLHDGSRNRATHVIKLVHHRNHPKKVHSVDSWYVWFESDVEWSSSIPVFKSGAVVFCVW